MNPLLRNTVHSIVNASSTRYICPSLLNKTKADKLKYASSNYIFGSYRFILQQVGGSSSIRQQIVSTNQLGLADVRIYSNTASLDQRFCTQKLETYQARAFSSSNQSGNSECKNKAISGSEDRVNDLNEKQSENPNKRKIDGGSALETPIISPQTIVWVDSLSDTYGSGDDHDSGDNYD